MQLKGKQKTKPRNSKTRNQGTAMRIQAETGRGEDETLIFYYKPVYLSYVSSYLESQAAKN